VNNREAQRKVRPVANREPLPDLLQDLAGPVRVFSPHVPVVRHPIPALEDPLGCQSATQTVRKSTLTRNDGCENASRPQETLDFSESRRKVVEVFEHVNRYHAIEILVGIGQPLLAIADAGRDLGEVPIDRFSHALPQLDRVVLLRLEVLEAKMLPKAGTDLECPQVPSCGAQRIPMIEVQDAWMG
jgi:hypothetical protein